MKCFSEAFFITNYIKIDKKTYKETCNTSDWKVPSFWEIPILSIENHETLKSFSENDSSQLLSYLDIDKKVKKN